MSTNIAYGKTYFGKKNLIKLLTRYKFKNI